MTDNSERIRVALDDLRDALDDYVETVLKAEFGDDNYKEKYAVPDWSGEDFNIDVHLLANTIINNWDDVFSSKLHKEARHLVHQVRKSRNRFAHQEKFDHDDTYSALHEMQRLLEAIGSDSAARIESSKNELIQHMATADESAEETARKAEEAADDLLSKRADRVEGDSPTLVLIQKGQPTDIELVMELPAIIGRSDASMAPIDIDLTDYEDAGYVSRKHATIYCEEGSYYLEDLGSSNGTFIKRDEFEKVEKVEIKNGDEIAFGNARFLFRTS